MVTYCQSAVSPVSTGAGAGGVIDVSPTAREGDSDVAKVSGWTDARRESHIK